MSHIADTSGPHWLPMEILEFHKLGNVVTLKRIENDPEVNELVRNKTEFTVPFDTNFILPRSIQNFTKTQDLTRIGYVLHFSGLC